MQVELTVTERLLILNRLLPTSGSVTQMRTVQKMIEAIGLTDEELEILKPEESDGRVVYSRENEAAIGPKQIELSDIAVSIIGKSLRALSDKEELPLSMLSLYDKFCGE